MQIQSDNIFERKKSLFIPILVLVSVLFALLLAEVFLRIITPDKSAYYSGFLYDRELNSLKYKVDFLQQNKERVRWSNINHDPYLGWDHNIQGGRVRETGNKEHIGFSHQEKKVITIGDSFTYGSEVGDKESYSYYLDEILSVESKATVLNMGVGGYGIDQAILKYLKYGRVYKPDMLILGVHTPNYERASLSFFSYYKPYYEIINDEVVLIERTIPPPEQGILQLQDEVDFLYLTPVIRKALIRLYWRLSSRDEANDYYKEMNTIVETMLENLLKRLDVDGTKLLIVNIPLGDHFYSDDKFEAAKQNPMYRNLLDIYKKLNIHHIDLLSKLPENYSSDTVFNDIYIPRTQVSRGHFSPVGNKIVARLIKDYTDEFLND